MLLKYSYYLKHPWKAQQAPNTNVTAPPPNGWCEMLHKQNQTSHRDTTRPEISKLIIAEL